MQGFEVITSFKFVIKVHLFGKKCSCFLEDDDEGKDEFVILHLFEQGRDTQFTFLLKDVSRLSLVSPRYSYL